MKKKLVSGMLAVILACSMSACSFSTVEITIPSSLVGNADTAELKEEAKDEGVKEIIDNEDGSITLKMSKSTQKKLLDSVKDSFDESIEETLDEEENTTSFDSIDYNDSLTEFTVNVDGSKFNDMESIYALTFCIMGNLYQSLNNVPESDQKTIVNFVDKDSKEVIQSVNSTEVMDALSDMEKQ